MSAYDKKYKFWVATKDQLENVVLKQKILEKVQAVDQRFTAHCVHADMYCDYLNLVNKLGYIYHRTFQVQKREFLTRLLQAAGTRLCELRNELKDIELSEFIYIDRTIIQRKLTYDMVQLIRPDFFPFVRNQEISNLIKNPRPKEVQVTEQEEKKVKLAAKRGIQVKDLFKEQELPPKVKFRQEAIILIQAHERLRIKRILNTNIKYEPKKYLPTPDSFVAKQTYKYTHKPDQDMLIPLRKTTFFDDYYKKTKAIKSFEFYIKPETKKIADLGESEVQKPINKPETEEHTDVAAGGDIRKTKSITFSKDELFSVANVGDRMSDAEQGRSSLKLEKLKDYAARKIQGAWKVFLVKRAYQKRLEKRAIIYKIASERKPIKHEFEEIYKKSYELKTIKDQYVRDFVKAVENESNRIIVKHTAGIMEDISDHIRFWIRNFYEQTDELPPFPPEAKGGTILVLQESTITTRQFNLNKTKTKAQLAAEAKKLRDDVKKEKKQIKLKAKQDAKKEKQFMAKIAKEGKIYYEFEKIFSRNKSTKAVGIALNEINDKWYYDVDEKSNIKETPFLTWISEEKFAEVHVELRRVVDAILRLEYEKLRQALASDRKQKYKPPKVPKPKKEKKPKQRKIEKDLTVDLTIPEIYYKMEDTGLIHKYKKRCFEEFFGDFNYCAYELKNFFELEVKPSTLEVRNILREWILGMGPLQLPKYKSILIGGPPQSAKVQLCEILASEIDAVMINLSIEVVAKYQDNIEMLLHLVNKMSRILQPTIIFIENVHRTFWKKVPPNFQSLAPLLLSKYLQKNIVKQIKEDEKIFVLGTTDEPWTGSGKMNTAFEKVILMPKTDYSSAFIFWRKLILQNYGVRRDLEFSPLAWVCKNFTSGQIAENVSKTLNIDRRMLLSQKKLQFNEFIETFISSNLFPAPEESYDKYYKWYGRANKLAKKRTQVMRILKKKK